jgi:tRNA(adenine34) deaminase
MQPDDEIWMRRAIDLARQGDADPGSNPIGCVIVRDGQVIGEGHNEVARRFDSTAHAEIVAIRDAGQRLSCSEFRGATLYSTLQPCGMCSMAVIWSKISRVVYGAGRGDVHEMYFEARHLDTMDYIGDAYRDDLSIEGGVLARDCAGFYEARDADVPKGEQVNR